MKQQLSLCIRWSSQRLFTWASEARSVLSWNVFWEHSYATVSSSALCVSSRSPPRRQSPVLATGVSSLSFVPPSTWLRKVWKVSVSSVLVSVCLHEMYLDSLLAKTGLQNLNYFWIWGGLFCLMALVSRPCAFDPPFKSGLYGDVFSAAGIVSPTSSMFLLWLALQMYRTSFELGFSALRLLALSFIELQAFHVIYSCGHYFCCPEHQALIPTPDLPIHVSSFEDHGLMHRCKLRHCCWRTFHLQKVMIRIS